MSGSDTAYWEALFSRWGQGEDLVNIEQDIEIHAQVLGQFTSCLQPWCVFPYSLAPYGDMAYIALGCTRFRYEVQDLVSAADIAAVPNHRKTSRHWSGIDAPVARAMAAHGVPVCVHSPPVGHRGWYHGCVPCINFASQCLRCCDSARSCFQSLEAWSAVPPSGVMPVRPPRKPLWRRVRGWLCTGLLLTGLTSCSRRRRFRDST